MSNILAASRIVGMMPVAQLAWLAEKATTHQRMVEIGCWRGRTTRALCDNCPGKVTAVDTWLGSPGISDEIIFMEEVTGDSDWLFHEFQSNLTNLNNLEICRKESKTAANLFAHDNRTFDFIFIDALHDYESVKEDIQSWLPMLESGGILAGHDLLFPSVEKAVMEIFPKFTTDGAADIWVIQKDPE